MLLVNDCQSEVLEFNFFFDQRMSANHQIRIALENVTANLTLAVRLQGTGEQHDAISQRFKQTPGRDVVLGGEYLGRRHERGLVSIFDRDHCCLERHDSLAGADVPLEQTPHGRGAMHVVRDFFHHALLRRGRMKRKKLLDCIAHLVGNLKRDSWYRAKLFALQLEADLEKKQLFKDETLVRGRLP